MYLETSIVFKSNLRGVHIATNWTVFFSVTKNTIMLSIDLFWAGEWHVKNYGVPTHKTKLKSIVMLTDQL